MKNLITIKNVTVTYPNCMALNNISVSITDQQNIIGIIGPNGAGKTTLIHSIMDILKIEEKGFDQVFSILAEFPNTIESIQRSNYSLDTAFIAAVMKYKDTYYEKTN